MEMDDIKKKIKSGELTLSKSGGKSDVWKSFVDSDNICVGVSF